MYSAAIYEAPAAVEAGAFTDLTRRFFSALWLDNNTGSNAWQFTQGEEIE
jgi:hypothetical protein